MCFCEVTPYCESLDAVGRAADAVVFDWTEPVTTRAHWSELGSWVPCPRISLRSGGLSGGLLHCLLVEVERVVWPWPCGLGLSTSRERVPEQVYQHDWSVSSALGRAESTMRPPPPQT